jgi:hypothetical protein
MSDTTRESRNAAKRAATAARHAAQSQTAWDNRRTAEISRYRSSAGRFRHDPPGDDLPINGIIVQDRLRPIDDATVANLMHSIHRVGLQSPIIVRRGVQRDTYVLVAGAHRLEAYKRLATADTTRDADGQFEYDRIKVEVLEHVDDEGARLHEVVENLHRGELTELQIAEHVAEYRRLDALRASYEQAETDVEPGPAAETSPPPQPEPEPEPTETQTEVALETEPATESEPETKADKPVQVGHVSRGGRGNTGGISQAARDLGMSRQQVARRQKIATITPEGKEAATAAGLADNQSALLAVAAEESAEEQVLKVYELIAPKPIDVATCSNSFLKTFEEWWRDDASAADRMWVRRVVNDDTPMAATAAAAE